MIPGTKIMNTQPQKRFFEIEGVVTAALPELRFIVGVEYKGIKHIVNCHVSGKMKTRFISLEVGDKVRIQISLDDINKGIITRRLTMRNVKVGPESV